MFKFQLKYFLTSKRPAEFILASHQNENPEISLKIVSKFPLTKTNCQFELFFSCLSYLKRPAEFISAS
ncbi:hypothetical protein, partial [Tenacibaculum finnmarkense]|uniref:hypothetical protein n=1 Tax=Tenacibaculum finnmarkense TaxID=2781243 RepID=UPI001C20BED3